jgi:glycosyltransferase involved in cell wall biosynthesis
MALSNTNPENFICWTSLHSRLDTQIILVQDFAQYEGGNPASELLGTLSGAVQVYAGNFGTPGAARNEGLKYANGEWIMFCDADDLLNVPAVLESIDSCSAGAEALVGQYDVVDRIKGRTVTSDSKKLIDVALNPGLWRIAFRSEVVKDKKFREMRMAEDQVFLLEIGFVSLNIEYTNSGFYQYFVNINGQLTSNPSALADLTEASAYIANKYEELPRDEKDFAYILLFRQLIAAITRLSPSAVIEMLIQLIKLSGIREVLLVAAITLKLAAIRLSNHSRGVVSRNSEN